MFRPSTERGMPAFGCAASGRVVTARTRSIASSIATGPMLQLQPMTSALPVGELGGESLRIGTVKAVGIFVHRHRCNHAAASD